MSSIPVQWPSVQEWIRKAATALNPLTRIWPDLYVPGNLTIVPGSSVTPVSNGDLVVEATSNTSVTIKLKGTDGTVRSVSLTLV